MTRRHLANRRLAETFELEVAGLRYTCTVGWFPDGSIAELFLSNHKTNSAADINARDSAIVFSIAVQCGADPEVIRRALSRDSQGRALTKFLPHGKNARALRCESRHRSH